MKSILSLMMVMILALGLLVCFSCGDDDDDDDSGSPPVEDDDDTVDDDDTSDDDDTTDDDDTGDDDDTVDDDDDDDDDNDDDEVPDDFVANWPQSNVEDQDYDETGIAGPLREKAEDYDDWHLTWHQPDHGSCVHAYFADTNYDTITGYHGHGDSTIWTGTYMASEAFRYWVTGDAQAKTNAMNKVETLSGHLHVTGRPGFIARYWGDQGSISYPGDAACDTQDRCHRVETGDYAGDFWLGETSRDQYTGWFYGMGVAYDLIDDEDTRDIIRDDVTEVLDELLPNYWYIIDEAGEPTDAAPHVLPPMQLSWILVGYHITGLDRFKTELQKKLLDSYRIQLQFNSIAFFNRYGQYFGNNLAHTNWYNILRLGKVYFSEDDYAFLEGLFNNLVHSFTRLSHNPWFTAIYMGEGGYVPSKDDEYQTQLEGDLGDFRDVPLGEYLVEERDPATYTLDPISVFMTDLQTQFPFLADLMGTFHYQALEPTTVDQYCPAGFMFQWSPFNIEACGADNPTKVHSGHDYLAAYWMASYHKFITKEM